MPLILLVEDVVAEQERAKQVLREQGFTIAVAGTLQDALRIWEQLSGKIVGIITDLHFPEGVHDLEKGSDKPAGLALVAECVLQAMPVVMCSNIDHHYARYATGVVRALQTHQAYASIGRIPFIMDSKNWQRAGEELGSLIRESKKEELHA